MGKKTNCCSYMVPEKENLINFGIENTQTSTVKFLENKARQLQFQGQKLCFVSHKIQISKNITHVYGKHDIFPILNGTV